VCEWEKVTVRPVELRGIFHYQFSYFDGKQDVTRNYAPEQLDVPLAAILDSGFANFHVQSSEGDLHVRITKKGCVLMSRGRPSLVRDRHRLEHNREKAYLLSPAAGKAVYRITGIADADGQIKPTMQAKFRQVNAFLKLMDEKLDSLGDRALRVVDCGCGSAFLTLAAFAYLNDVKGREVTLVGIDQNEALIAKCQQAASDLGWDKASFASTTIGDYSPEERPNIVLSLHACDTATDEALAQGVHWGADLIMAAPCCQQELAGQVASDLHGPVLRHGILKQRTADILTDAARAQLLQIAGYRAEVIEFISSEETSKNLMIRAEKAVVGDIEPTVRAYQDLKAFWSISPSLEGYLGDVVAERLDKCASAGL
jgi:SAM-dependent methyltransferase